ncbi:glycosyltransferase [Candidatus Woesearchaeota archaeon]|nr:glycosyltransferase [Candidatus Woesearchaeota archaeon]
MDKELSILIGTHNRYNLPYGIPLSWTLDSIDNQSYKPDVLVVDDNSKIEQSKNIEKKCKEYGFKYFKSDKRLGCSGIRRYALEFIKSPWHLILDDDSVFYNEKTIEKILSYIEFTKKDTGAVIFPAYNRLPFPTSFVPLENIGKIDMSKGINSWFLTSFPEELISSKDKFPLIPISLGASYGIYNTLALKEVGGFRSSGKNDYAMESELVWRLKDKGYNIFYLPDPKTACLHLKFGVKSLVTLKESLDSIPLIDLEKIKFILNDSLEGILSHQLKGFSISQIIDSSNCFDLSGGCRDIREQDWIKDRISNEFAQIVRYYPFSKKRVGMKGYAFRMIKQSKSFKISRRDSLNLSCNIDKESNNLKQTLNVIKGLFLGIYKGLKWYIK